MMQHTYPYKKLITLSLWLITVCTLFIFSFIILFWSIKGLNDAILGSVLTFIILTLLSIANILLLSLYEKQIINERYNKGIYYGFSYLSSFLIFLLVVVSNNHLSGQPTNFLDIINLVLISIFVNSLILIFHNYTILQDAKIHADMENSHLKVLNTEAANQLLRQQIHPHFFFNALNILKSLYKLDPDAADEYLVSLSDFLRMSLSANNIKVFALKDELKLCDDYLTMQKIRFGEALLYSVSIPEEVLREGFVPSFSVQPLLENAIKHNELTKASPLQISIELAGDRIRVSNNMKSKATSETSTGIGLANLAERYRILSGDEIIIENTGDTFSVSIKILEKQALSANSDQSNISIYRK